MSINTSDYTNGASFQGGSLKVTDTVKVENLNASYLQGKVPSNFLQLGNDFGVTQNAKVLGATGVTANLSSSAANIINNSSVNLDESSEIKIGNLLIKSSSDGFGILIGTTV